jgi:hypothetical protein
MHDWALGTGGEWVTMGVPSNGEYGIPKDVMFGYPVTCEGGKYKIVEGLPIDAFSQGCIDKTLAELLANKTASSTCSRPTAALLQEAATWQPGLCSWPTHLNPTGAAVDALRAGLAAPDLHRVRRTTPRLLKCACARALNCTARARSSTARWTTKTRPWGRRSNST